MNLLQPREFPSYQETTSLIDSFCWSKEKYLTSSSAHDEMDHGSDNDDDSLVSTKEGFLVCDFSNETIFLFHWTNDEHCN
jgi:hypothetical protein